MTPDPSTTDMVGKVRPTIRERLAKMLVERGYQVEWHALHSVQGYYRINREFDDTTVCWDVWTDERIQRYVYSRDTMTDCVRRGFSVLLDGNYVEVIVKD